jgi:hypothetical protein
MMANGSGKPTRMKAEPLGLGKKRAQDGVCRLWDSSAKKGVDHSKNVLTKNVSFVKTICSHH